MIWRPQADACGFIFYSLDGEIMFLAPLSFFISMIDSPEDQDKFTLLYTRYRGVMYRIARRILKNDIDAEDAVQEAFLSIINNISSIDMDRQPYAYVCVVVQNKANDKLKKQNRSLLLDDDAFAYLENKFASGSIDDEVEDKEAVNSVLTCILNLPKIYRDVMQLFYVDELSTKKIAALLNIKETTVRGRLFKGRLLLKNMLIDKGIAL